MWYRWQGESRLGERPAIHEQDAENVRQRRSRVAQRLNVQHRVRFASSLAVALLGGHFEHPVWLSDAVPHIGMCDGLRRLSEFFRSLLEQPASLPVDVICSSGRIP